MDDAPGWYWPLVAILVVCAMAFSFIALIISAYALTLSL